MAQHCPEKKKPLADENQSIISLFSGAMGLDLGLEAAGFHTALALEIDPNAIETIILNRPTLPIITDKIEYVTAQELLQKSGLCQGQTCIVSGGPCCQTFSTVGKRESLSDSRGKLFHEFKRVVAEIRPRFFVMENVKGILSAAVKHRPLKKRGPGHPPLSPDEELGSALRVICRELQELQYYVVFGLLNCADYGTPQTRWRVIFIGSRDGEDIALPPPSHAETITDGKLPWVTLRQSIYELKEKEPKYTEFRVSQKAYLRRLHEGENWRKLSKKLQQQALGGAFDSWGGRCGFYRRLSWNKPAPTLTTCPTGQATTLCHPTELRPLSIEEYRVLQQFPHSWKFAGTIKRKYIQIGNAVPLGLGKAIGTMIRKVMENTQRQGLPVGSKTRKGSVICGDLILAERLTKRPRTKLEPSRFRLDPDPEAAHRWLTTVA